MMRPLPAVLALALLGPAATAQETAPAAPAPEPSPAARMSAPPDARPVLELSLQDAVTRAMENNVDIAVERFSPLTSEESVNEVRGSYDPQLGGSFSLSSRATPATNAFAGAEKVDTDTDVFGVEASKLLPTGGSLRLGFDNSRSETNSVYTTFNPSWSSSLTASLSQPLLKNRRTDATRYRLKVAKKNREISDVQFRQTVTNTLAGVKQLYYDYLYTLDNLEAQRKSLALAERLLAENQIRVKVGTMAPLDVVAAEAEVASRAEAVILAEKAVGDAEEALKVSLFPASAPEMWALRLVPTDRPTAEPVAIDVETAVRRALEGRTDVLAARKGLENAAYGVDYARNQTLPGVDLVASYGTAGIGGTQVLDATTREMLATPVPGGLGDALGDVFARDYPTWSVGVNVSYPLFNRAARASRARAQIGREQAEASLRRLEMNVVTQVRTAARAVDSNFKRVESTRAARVLAERRLDAETKKFAAGMSTNFLVTQSQRDLSLAEVAELRAVADFRKSLVSFERVQEAGLGGGGSTAIITN